MSQAQDDLVAAASNPNAELTTLHELANNYPGLRPYIAENPRTYPALLEWLGTLGDPAVDAALARRNAPAASPSAADAAASATQVLSAGQSGGQDLRTPYEQRALAETQRQQPIHAAPIQPTQQVQQPRPVSPAQPAAQTQYQPQYQQTQYQQPVGQTQYTQPQYAAGQQHTHRQQGYRQPAAAASQGLFGVGEEAEEETAPRSSWWLWGLAAFAIIAVTALAIWFVTSGDDDTASTSATTNAAGQSSAAPQTQAASRAPSTSPSASTSASASASATPSRALVAPAPASAIEMSSFSAPSGNITCTLGQGSVSCTINKHDFVPADASCNNSTNTPFTVSVGSEGDASGSCGTPFNASGATLDYGSSAKNDTFACTSSDNGIECWSQVSGKGFTLAREDASIVSR